MHHIDISFSGMDLTDFKPKVDHFEEIHALGDANRIIGAPNFRLVAIEFN